MSDLNPQAFDQALARRTRPAVIWTASLIGRRIGRSPEYVRRTLAKLPGTPIRRMANGNLYAIESELLAFLEAQGGDGK